MLNFYNFDISKAKLIIKNENGTVSVLII